MFLDPGETAAVFGAAAEPSNWKEEYNARSLGESKLHCATGHSKLEAYEVKFGKDAVEVDVCPRCRGLWLDKDEGAKLYNIVAQAKEHAEKKELGIEKPGLGMYVFQIFTGFPVEVWNPVKRKPVIVYSLVAILAVAWIVQIIVLAGLGEVGAKEIIPFFWAIPAKILKGEYVWTLFTCGFFHGGIMHIVGNLYFLWIFGDNVEDTLGRQRFIILYLVSLIAGSALHVLFNPTSEIPMLGASGAISGLMGAYLVLFPRVKMWVVIFLFRFKIGVIWYLGFWIVTQIVAGFAHEQGVAWFAHIGGFIAGAILAFIYKRKLAEVL